MERNRSEKIKSNSGLKNCSIESAQNKKRNIERSINLLKVSIKFKKDKG
jgi:hypothetical protein